MDGISPAVLIFGVLWSVERADDQPNPTSGLDLSGEPVETVEPGTTHSTWCNKIRLFQAFAIPYTKG